MPCRRSSTSSSGRSSTSTSSSQVAGSFDFQFGDERDAVSNHPVLTLLGSSAGAIFLIADPRCASSGTGCKKMWVKAKAGAAILGDLSGVREVGAPAADGRLCREGRGDHRLPRRVRHPGHLRIGHERARLEPAREPPLLHALAASASTRRSTRSRSTSYTDVDDRHRLLASGSSSSRPRSTWASRSFSSAWSSAGSGGSSLVQRLLRRREGEGVGYEARTRKEEAMRAAKRQGGPGDDARLPSIRTPRSSHDDA